LKQVDKEEGKGEDEKSSEAVYTGFFKRPPPKSKKSKTKPAKEAPKKPKVKKTFTEDDSLSEH